MESIDICGGDGGNIWGRKPAPRKKDGLVQVNLYYFYLL